MWFIFLALLFSVLFLRHWKRKVICKQELIGQGIGESWVFEEIKQIYSQVCNFILKATKRKSRLQSKNLKATFWTGYWWIVSFRRNEANFIHKFAISFWRRWKGKVICKVCIWKEPEWTVVLMSHEFSKKLKSFYPQVSNFILEATKKKVR